MHICQHWDLKIREILGVFSVTFLRHLTCTKTRFTFPRHALMLSPASAYFLIYILANVEFGLYLMPGAKWCTVLRKCHYLFPNDAVVIITASTHVV